MALLAPTKARVRATPQPSAGVWPGLHEVARSPIHAAIARRLTKAAVKNLPITLEFPDGANWGAGGPVLQVVRPEWFFRRLGTEGLIGFGEAWMTYSSAWYEFGDAELGFDDTFIRMWNFYLAYSQAGFAAEYLDDWQLGIGRP
jgi:hypothetical protein